MRQVIKTKVEEFGPFIRHWRFYDDGAWALRRVKSDKTVKTIFTDGKGHWFEKNLESGWDRYININAGFERERDIRTGEVRWYGPGRQLLGAVLMSGDATLDAAN